MNERSDKEYAGSYNRPDDRQKEKNGLTFVAPAVAALAQGTFDKHCNLASSLHRGIGIRDRNRSSAPRDSQWHTENLIR